MHDLLALIGYGFLLGWSVAWPPGPINAEMIRRGLARGARPALAVGLGACSGDAMWAVAVTLGIGLILGPRLQLALALVSTVLLLALAALFLGGAWRSWRGRKGVDRVFPPRVESREVAVRSGYWLGLGMALTSPWNFAFWLAVIGRPHTLAHGLAGALVIAAAVLVGAASWCVLLCAFLSRLSACFSGYAWQIAARAATGALMLFFALEQVRALLIVGVAANLP